MTFGHFYRWRRYGDHFTGRRCRIVARGTLNSLLVEFENGEKAVVSRYAVRRVK